MSDIEISDETLFTALQAAYSDIPIPELSATSNQMLRGLKAAYPSIRRQVLEEAVEGVAELIGDYREVGSVADDYRIARRVLGLDGEGEEAPDTRPRASPNRRG